MPRKPNYKFERNQREKNKATKKAERLQAKAEKLAARKAKADGAESDIESDVEAGAAPRVDSELEPIEGDKSG
jgi:hypothetical protein